MKPEEKARQKIDQLLTDAGWVIQDHKELDLGSSLGVAVREFPVETGYADYMLFVDRKAVGVIEAKPEGTTLSRVEYDVYRIKTQITDCFGDSPSAGFPPAYLTIWVPTPLTSHEIIGNFWLSNSFCGLSTMVIFGHLKGQSKWIRGIKSL